MIAVSIELIIDEQPTQRMAKPKARYRVMTIAEYGQIIEHAKKGPGGFAAWLRTRDGGRI